LDDAVEYHDELLIGAYDSGYTIVTAEPISNRLLKLLSSNPKNGYAMSVIEVDIPLPIPKDVEELVCKDIVNSYTSELLIYQIEDFYNRERPPKGVKSFSMPFYIYKQI
jgi:hypothetical protein